MSIIRYIVTFILGTFFGIIIYSIYSDRRLKFLEKLQNDINFKKKEK